MIIFITNKYYFLIGVHYEIDNDLLTILRKTYVDRISLQLLENTTLLRRQLLDMYASVKK